MLWLFLHLHSQPALLLVSLQLLRDLPDDLLRRCHRTIATIAARQRLLHRIDNADAAIPESPYVLRRDFLPRATHSQPSPLAQASLARTWYHMYVFIAGATRLHTAH